MTASPVRASLRSKFTTRSALLVSRPVVGSSQNKISGLLTTSTAIVTRFRCSALSPAAGVPMMAS